MTCFITDWIFLIKNFSLTAFSLFIEYGFILKYQNNTLE